jgi:hypothetical protein
VTCLSEGLTIGLTCRCVDSVPQTHTGCIDASHSAGIPPCRFRRMSASTYIPRTMATALAYFARMARSRFPYAVGSGFPLPLCLYYSTGCVICQ